MAVTLVGWCPGGRPVAEMLARFEGTGVGRIFVGPGDPLPSWDGPVLGPLVAAGAVVHLSYKTNPLADVLAWVARKPPGLLLKLTRNHEPEQQRGGDPTVAQFHAAWAELVAALADVPGRDEMLLGPVYTRYWWEKHPGDRRWLLRVPVDFVGWDVYSDLGYRSPADLLSIPRQVAAETGVPYLVAELGALPGAGRAAWMRAMVAAIAADGGLTACWYHREGWDLTDQPDLPVWQAIIKEATVTTAPPNLLAVRALLLAELGLHGLAPGEVGIVGDPAHRGGYHCGRDRVVSGDYSVVESSRDRAGLSGYASGLDVGEFSVRSGGTTHNLRTFSTWMVRQCASGAADARDIREVIYSPDGRTVRRWDACGRRTSGDGSHVYHTHFSFFRDATKAGRDLTPLFRRYLAEIGLTTTEGVAQMFCKHGDRGENVRALQYALHNIGFPPGTIDGTYGDATAAALKKAEASIGVTSDGKTYDADSYTRIQALFVKRFSAGERGPKGDPGGLTMDQVATELAARITAGPAAT
ncbi:peptidoglycan-binding domain-containing protein [Micromonospora tulbaghiae]|uniref:peptidoglycan-binding domain-containing protein n=1 Tax=Micromonospora tulbaghiae TaxID=479978 RepID=UPI0013C52D11|nr:peptidoglycan-binding protein [Micromonospora tulbaghiae]